MKLGKEAYLQIGRTKFSSKRRLTKRISILLWRWGLLFAKACSFI